jgi:hypothetical protein
MEGRGIIRDRDATAAKSAARALMGPAVQKIPEKRREELAQVVMDYGRARGFAVTDREDGQVDLESLGPIMAEIMSVETSIKTEEFVEHGKAVINYIKEKDKENGLQLFVQEWRAHFLEVSWEKNN